MSSYIACIWVFILLVWLRHSTVLGTDPSDNDNDNNNDIGYDNDDDDDGHDSGAGSGPDSTSHTKRMNGYFICLKPAFFTQYKCTIPKDDAVLIGERIQLDITKMPFKMDQWLHIDVVPIVEPPTPDMPQGRKPLKFKHAVVQMSDSKNRIIGRIAEQIPCTNIGHPLYEGGKGKMEELFKNPGLSGSQVMECDETESLNQNLNPTVPVLNFNPPVEAFYINLKLTMEEAKLMQRKKETETVSITTLLVDENDACHVHFVDKLKGLPALEKKSWPIKVPIACHSAGPAFTDERGATGGFMMTATTISMENVQFGDSLGGRPNSRLVSLGSREHRSKLQDYNNKMYNVDSQGYLPGEKEKERKNKKVKKSAMRRPAVPLLILDNKKDKNNTNETEEYYYDEDDEESLSSRVCSSCYLLYIAFIFFLFSQY